MKQKDILLILGSLCISTIAWILFNVYHNTFSSTIPETVAAEVNPITPDFDVKTVTQLKQRQKVSPLFKLPTSPSLVNPLASPTPSPNNKTSKNATGSSFLR